jgi:hypothetical protein
MALESAFVALNLFFLAKEQASAAVLFVNRVKKVWFGWKRKKEGEKLIKRVMIFHNLVCAQIFTILDSGKLFRWLHC